MEKLAAALDIRPMDLVEDSRAAYSEIEMALMDLFRELPTKDQENLLNFGYFLLQQGRGEVEGVHRSNLPRHVLDAQKAHDREKD